MQAVMQHLDSIVRWLKDLETRVLRLETQGLRFVPLTTPKTSTSWDGDSYSTTAWTLLDLSAVFSVPANIKAVLLRARVNDSGSAGAAARIAFGTAGSDATTVGVVSCEGLPNDTWAFGTFEVPCQVDGDIYYTIVATGASTLDVDIKIWGYWI